MNEICVVHLVRKCNGVGPLQRFLESYRLHPAGIEHDLLFILKGFDDKTIPDDYRLLLNEYPHHVIWLEDRGFDIVPYTFAAQILEQRYLCFFNSFSIILGDDWLVKLYRQVTVAGVGIAGASGSWESIYTNCRTEQLERVVPLGKRVARFYDLWVRKRLFHPFPNPHLRTNGFIISRELLNRIGRKRIKTKMDAHRFESGRDGLSGSIRSMGLSLIVVGRDGRGFSVEEWPRSGTFRLGGQDNLLVADNQTRGYEDARAEQRNLLTSQAWGNLVYWKTGG